MKGLCCDRHQVFGMTLSDGTVKEYTADEVMLDQMCPSVHSVGNIVLRRQTGLIAPPKLQIAVADIVARHHRANEVEAAVGRYTPSARCRAKSSATAVCLARSRLETAMSCLASGSVDTAILAHNQSSPAPENVRFGRRQSIQTWDFCPSSAGPAGVAQTRCLQTRSI